MSIEMVAMPFPCYGILVVLGNLPRIFPMSLLNLINASFLIPIVAYFDQHLGAVIFRELKFLGLLYILTCVWVLHTKRWSK